MTQSNESFEVRPRALAAVRRAATEGQAAVLWPCDDGAVLLELLDAAWPHDQSCRFFVRPDAAATAAAASLGQGRTVEVVTCGHGSDLVEMCRSRGVSVLIATANEVPLEGIRWLFPLGRWREGEQAPGDLEAADLTATVLGRLRLLGYL